MPATKTSQTNRDDIDDRVESNQKERDAEFGAMTSVTLNSTGSGEQFRIFGRWRTGTAAGTYFIVLNNGGTLEIIGQFIVPNNSMPGTFAISESLPAGRFTVGSNTAGPNSITVYSGELNASGQGAEAWSLGSFNPDITATLNGNLKVTSNNSSVSGAVIC